jgi:hypothetical protein
MFCSSGRTHFDSKNNCYGPLKYGTRNVQKFTYEHVGSKIFPGVIPPDPREEGEGQGTGREGEWNRKEREGQEGRGDRRGGERRGGETPLS